MRKSIFVIVIVSLFFLSCSLEEEKQTENNLKNDKLTQSDMHTSKNSIDWVGKYFGVLPCADCEGIEITIILDKDQKYKRVTKYLGKDEKEFKQEGSFTWNKEENQITLMDISNGPSIYFVGENSIIQLDINGEKINGDLANNYVLKKVVSNTITNTKWVLTELRGKKVELEMPGERVIFLLLSSENNKVHGFAGCNNFNGTYELKENDRIKFSENMAITMMACPDMKIEQEFIKVLSQADSYNLVDNRLILNKARMAPLARFEAEN
jgi:heat shock protein HslJ